MMIIAAWALIYLGPLPQPEYFILMWEIVVLHNVVIFQPERLDIVQQTVQAQRPHQPGFQRQAIPFVRVKV